MRRAALLALLLSGCQSENFGMSKPGASREESQQDIRRCEEKARGFVRNRPATARDHKQVYDRLVIDCLRERGYAASGG